MLFLYSQIYQEIRIIIMNITIFTEHYVCPNNSISWQDFPGKSYKSQTLGREPVKIQIQLNKMLKFIQECNL